MTRPLPVRIVRPHKTPSELAGVYIASIGAAFLSAWFFMLLVPFVIGPHLSYWQSLGLFALTRIAFGRPPLLDSWSLRGKKDGTS